jgi:hypothetical protein
MLSDSELKRIKMRAEHILSIGRKHGQDSLIYHVLRGDAMDVLSLLEEIEYIKASYLKMKSTDFKLITPAEIKVLLKGSQKDDN